MFRDKLRELMQERNLTAKDLASLIETDEDREKGVKLFRIIENWSGRRASMPAADRAVAIARALGVSVEYMVDGRDNSKEYAELRLLALAKKYSDFLECLESLDPLTLETVRVQVKAVARASGNTRDMVAAETAEYGENAK